MNDNQSCDNCSYFYMPQKGSLHDSGQGYCRRHAPTPLQNFLSDGDDVQPSVWPIVNESDWCGEYLPK